MLYEDLTNRKELVNKTVPFEIQGKSSFPRRFDVLHLPAKILTERLAIP